MPISWKGLLDGYEVGGLHFRLGLGGNTWTVTGDVGESHNLSHSQALVDLTRHILWLRESLRCAKQLEKIIKAMEKWQP